MDVASKHALSGTELMVKLYADYLLPLLVRVKRTAINNKARVITAAVALTLLYRVAHKIWRPPKALRQVPYIGFFKYLLARVDRNATAEDLARRFTLPAALQTEEGLYVVCILVDVKRANLFIPLSLSTHAHGRYTLPIHAGRSCICLEEVDWIWVYPMSCIDPF